MPQQRLGFPDALLATGSCGDTYRTWYFRTQMGHIMAHLNIYVAWAGLKPAILQPQAPEYWNYRRRLPRLAVFNFPIVAHTLNAYLELGNIAKFS